MSDAKDRASAEAVFVGVRVLCGLFDVSAKTIHEWQRLGMPRAGPNSYPLGECIRWRRTRDREIESARDGTLARERIQLIAEQIRKFELDNHAKAVELLPREDAEAAFRAVFDILDAHLEALPDVAPALVGIADPMEVQTILRRTCRDARQSAGAALLRLAEGMAGDATR